MSPSSAISASPDVRFNRDRAQLIALSEQLSALHPGDSYRNKLHNIRQALRDEKFRLVVLGQFKRGKSTFINALLGRDVLPVDVIPATSVITEIYHDTEPRAVIVFNDGHKTETEIQRLADFVSESKNPQNVKQVRKVCLYCTADILSEGIILVDTPGVGSVHAHNTQLTNDYLPQADAAIFLFSADPPLTELEQKFIQMFLPLIPGVFYVLNKKDYLEPQALRRVSDFNLQIIRRLTQKEPIQIYSISALQGLRAKQQGDDDLLDLSGIKDLQAELETFIIKNQGRLLLLSNADRLERIATEIRNLLQLERRARSLSVEQLQSNLEQFRHFMDRILQNEKHISYLLDGVAARRMEAFDEAVAAFAETAGAAIKTAVFVTMAENGAARNAVLAKIAEAKINDLVVEHFEPFRLQQEKHVKENYERELEEINSTVTEVVNKIYRFSADIFDLKDTSALPQESWRYRSHFHYRTEETQKTLDILENNMLTLLPRPLFAARQKKKIPQLIQKKLQRQCGRLRADILYRLKDNNRQFVFEFNQAVQRIRQSIEQLIGRNLQDKNRSEDRLSDLIKEQERWLRVLDGCLREIARIKEDWQQELKITNE